MRIKNFLIAATPIFFTQCVFSQALPPAIKKEIKIFKEHGSDRTDDYYWLSNPSDSNVINHLKAENAYVESYLKHTEPLQKNL